MGSCQARVPGRLDKGNCVNHQVISPYDLHCVAGKTLRGPLGHAAHSLFSPPHRIRSSTGDRCEVHLYLLRSGLADTEGRADSTD